MSQEEPNSDATSPKVQAMQSFVRNELSREEMARLDAHIAAGLTFEEAKLEILSEDLREDPGYQQLEYNLFRSQRERQGERGEYHGVTVDELQRFYSPEDRAEIIRSTVRDHLFTRSATILTLADRLESAREARHPSMSGRPEMQTSVDENAAHIGYLDMFQPSFYENGELPDDAILQANLERRLGTRGAGAVVVGEQHYLGVQDQERSSGAHVIPAGPHIPHGVDGSVLEGAEVRSEQDAENISAVLYGGVMEAKDLAIEVEKPRLKMANTMQGNDALMERWQIGVDLSETSKTRREREDYEAPARFMTGR